MSRPKHNPGGAAACWLFAAVLHRLSYRSQLGASDALLIYSYVFRNPGRLVDIRICKQPC
jgi:hypothetical protein